MTNNSARLLAAVALSIASLLPASNVAAQSAWQSPHETLLRAHQGSTPLRAENVGFPTKAQLEHRARDKGVTVMGYLPYWEDANNLPWEHLDVLAWFSAEVEADGSLSDLHGWGGSGSDALIEAAHAAGAIVVLSATRFGDEELAELLSSPTRRTTAVNNLIDAMTAGGGDGIDIDFEGLDLANRNDFINFIVELRTAMQLAQPDSYLSLATPAVDWDGAYDYDVLAEHSDLLFIMGYAFSGSWSDPRPNAPLWSSDQWGSRSLQWSAQDYIEWAGIENASEIVMGLPLYGGTWIANSDQLGAESIDYLGATFYDTCQQRFEERGRYWDSDSDTPWIAWQQDGQWRQTWCEDEVSIALKAQMALDQGLGGFGFWALNYDDADPSLWAAVSEVIEGRLQTGDDDDSAGGDDDDSAGGDDDDSTTGANNDSAGWDEDDALDPRDGAGCESPGSCNHGGAKHVGTRLKAGLLLALLIWPLAARRKRCPEPGAQ